MQRNARIRSVLSLSAALLASAVLSGCTTLRAGPGRFPTNFGYEGIVNGYASVNDLQPYDGDILEIDILDGQKTPGEILNVDVWPLVGVGIGLFGVRAHIISLGAGFGLLFYDPDSSWDLPNDGEVQIETD